MKTTEQGGRRGYDGGKKIVGRKRFVAVDSLGLMWAVNMTPAEVQDRWGGPDLIERVHHAVKFIKMVWGDSHFDTAIRHAWCRWGWPGQVVRLMKKQLGFIVQPKHWIVERTFAWLNRYRRLAKDIERTIESSKAFIQIAMIRIMVRRIHYNQTGFWDSLLNLMSLLK